MGNKDQTRDGDAAAETRDSRANRDHSRDWEASRDAVLAKTIAEAVALQTKSIVELFSKQSRGDTVHHRSILKADGEGTCTL